MQVRRSFEFLSNDIKNFKIAIFLGERKLTMGMTPLKTNYNLISRYYDDKESKLSISCNLIMLKLLLDLGVHLQ